MTHDAAVEIPYTLEQGVAALTAALGGQRGLYASLLELSHREEAAIMSGDVAELTRIVDDKEAVIEHINAIETERMTALVAIAAATGIDAQSATLSQIAAQLSEGAAATLVANGVELRVCAVAAREANDRNALLLRSSRELIERWIVYLRSVVIGAMYNAGGTAAGGPVSPRALDRSA